MCLPIPQSFDFAVGRATVLRALEKRRRLHGSGFDSCTHRHNFMEATAMVLGSLENCGRSHGRGFDSLRFRVWAAGGTGRRGALKKRCRKACGFESRAAH